MSVTFEAGTCGLIGPNGAGKTTFFNVLSGFVKPAAGSRPRVRRRPALRWPHFRRARWGLRRTFQTEQAIEELSVADNVALAHEHSKLGEPVGAARGRAARDRVRRARRRSRRARSARSARASGGWSRSRVRWSAGRASCCSTSPAAGLPDEETEHLGRVIQRIPEHTGALVILVDHDMSLVVRPAAR